MTRIQRNVILYQMSCTSGYYAKVFMLGISIPVSTYCAIFSIYTLNQQKCRRNVHLVCSSLILFVGTVGWIINELLFYGIPHGKAIGAITSAASLFACLAALNRYSEEIKFSRPILLNFLVGSVITIVHVLVFGWIIYLDIAAQALTNPWAALSITVPVFHLLLGSRSVYFVISKLFRKRTDIVDKDFMVRNFSASGLVLIWLIYIIVYGSKAISAEIYESVLVLFVSYALLSENMMIIESEQVRQNAIELKSPTQARHFFSITVGDALTNVPADHSLASQSES